MDSSLTGRTVVITRPRAASAALAAALRARGARVVFAPLIRIRPPRSRRALDSAIRRLQDFNAVAFTSANAVDFFFARTRALRVRPGRPAVVAAVGPATARALAVRGWKAHVVAHEAHAQGLARALHLKRGARVLLPCAERGLDVLPSELAALGVRVSRATAYRTVRDAAGRRALLKAVAAGADAVSFASISAAESAATAVGRSRLPRLLHGLAVVAIGPTTAAALRAYGVHALVARQPTPEALADAVVAALEKSVREPRA